MTEKEVQKLREERDFYKMVADNSNSWEYWSDRNANITYTSPSCKRVTGYDPEEFLNNKDLLFQIIKDEDKRIYLDHRLSIDSHELEKTIDFRIVHKNGDTVWLRHACNKVYDNNNRFIGIRGSNKIINELKKTELDLEASKEMLSMAQRIARIGNWEMDHELNKEKWSDEIYSILELDKDTTLPSYDTFLNRIHPEERTNLVNKYQESLKYNSSYSIETRLLMPDGRVKFIQLQCKTETIPEIKETISRGTIQDITHWKTIKTELKNKRIQLQQIFDTSPAVKLLINEKSEVIQINKTAEKYAGTLPDIVINYRSGDLFKCLYSTEDPRGCGFGRSCARCTLKNTIKDTLETKNTYSGIETDLYVVKDGKPEKHTFMLSTVITSEHPEINVLVTLDDITKRKKAEQALIESEDRFHEIFKHMSDGCVIYHYDKDKNDFSIVNANHACERIEKINKKDLINKYVTKVFPGIKEFGLFDILLEVHKSGNPQQFPSSFYQDKRLSGWRENFVYKLKNGNIVAIYADTTKEKENELKLIDRNKKLAIALKKAEKSEKLFKEANATKDRFFSILAHDLRSPFNSIMGFSDLLIGQYDNIPDEVRRNYINHIFEVANQTYELLENLLDWSRAQSGNLKLNPVKAELKEVITPIATSFHETAQAKEIELTTCFSVDPIHITCDKEMVNTVLRNLLGNALKFTPRGGNVSISAKEYKKSVKISVSDNGIGIPKNNIGKLFDVTEKVSTEGTEKEKGTGLGLILCKEFIEMHGGKISVISKEQEGTVFSFTIPKKLKN